VIWKVSSTGRYGSHTHLNGVYWVEIITRRRDGTVVVSNLHDGAKRKVKSVTGAVEADVLFPLLRGRDVTRWRAEPSRYILLPQDPLDPAKAIPVVRMQREFPKAFNFLRQFETELRNRSGFKQFFDPKVAPFYSVYNVGPYTFAPYKVCWREVASDISAAVCSSSEGKVVTIDHTLVGVACDSEEEAHFICALLNSIPANFVVRGYVTLHPSPAILKYIRISRFDPAKNKVDRDLAANSRALHQAVATGTPKGVASLEEENLELAAKYWSLGDDELRDIQTSMADLEGGGA
jgi:hypothetical protein